MIEQFEIVPVRKGGKSLRCLVRNETFHPVIGPMEEARILHVGQQKIVERAREMDGFVLWDVGLGAAANALSAVNALLPETSQVAIHSFDISLEPLKFAVAHAEDLPYLLPYREILTTLVEKGHVSPRPGLDWYFHGGDFQHTLKEASLPSPHGIFYDPYSPKGNMEMWTLDHFSALHARLDPAVPCMLTNYTRSTAVRATWLLAGFYVGVGCVIGDKAETTIASNHLELLEKPLDKEFLVKAWVSRNGAPLRGTEYKISPIELMDHKRLEAHPQFTARK